VDGELVFRAKFGERDSDWTDLPSGWLRKSLDLPEFVGGIRTVDIALIIRVGQARR
jgi:hypothetical protein